MLQGNGQPIYTPAARWLSTAVVSATGLLPLFGLPALGFGLGKLLVPPMAMPLGFVGLVLGIAAAIVIPAFAECAVIRWHRPRVRAKCEAAYGVNLADALHVGISSGREVRSFSGDTSSDIGFLVLETGAMKYLGDASAFVLRADQVSDVQITSLPGTPGLRFPRLSVTWRESPGTEPQILNLEVRDARSLRDIWERTRALRQQLEQWCLGAAPATAAPTLSGPAPPSQADAEKAPVFHFGNATGLELLAAGVIAIAVGVGVGVLALLVVGSERFASSWVLRYGGIAVAILLFNVLLVLFQKLRPPQ